MANPCHARSRSRTPPGGGGVVWEILLDHGWVPFDSKTHKMFADAEKASGLQFEYRARGQRYLVDIDLMHQINMATQVTRPIRRVVLEAESEAPSAPSSGTSRHERIKRLVAKLTSGSVQVQEVSLAEKIPLKLKPHEVAQVFTDHVPGVSKWLYREQPGVYALNFIQEAYKKGLRAFQDTPLHDHFLSLMRLIVHHGQEHKPDSATYLRHVAEAFMDCQAVQARVIERIGLQIRGVELDFRGQVVALVGEYKTLALKMLAAELKADEDAEPAHFENRLIADLGMMLGLNMDDIRRAELDQHAQARFPPATRTQQKARAQKLRELFDAEALLKAFMAEVQSFGGNSGAASFSRQFIDWASERMTNKHLIFDSETCTQVEITEALCLAVFEVLFFGKPHAPAEETYKGEKISDLFRAE